GTRRGQLFCWDERLGVVGQTLVDDAIRALFEDKDGGLWIGTRGRGIEVRRAGRMTHYTKQEGLSDSFVTGIDQTRDGAAWVGTKHGLNRIVNGRITRFYRKDGLGADCIQTLYVDATGMLWVGTAGGGLARFKEEHFGAVTARQGLP